MEYLTPPPQNVHYLNVGLELELYFRRLNVKYTKCLQTLSAHRSLPCFFSMKNKYLVLLGQISKLG